MTATDIPPCARNPQAYQDRRSPRAGIDDVVDAVHHSCRYIKADVCSGTAKRPIGLGAVGRIGPWDQDILQEVLWNRVPDETSPVHHALNQSTLT